MPTLLERLKQPYPLKQDRALVVRQALVSGGAVALFLFFFRPMGTDFNGESSLFVLFVSCCFGLVTAVCAIVWPLGIALLTSPTAEERWTVGKEMLSSIGFLLFLAFANMCCSNILFSDEFQWSHFFIWVYITMMVGIFPTLINVLLHQRRLMKTYQAAATEISSHIAPVEHLDIGLITLTGDNQNESLRLSVDALRYIAAADNYVQVHHIVDDQPRTTMLRSTLKKMEEALAGHPRLYRCHRTYLVNLDFVSHISGNAQGYRLHLRDENDISIPVSRNLNDEIRQLFS